MITSASPPGLRPALGRPVALIAFAILAATSCGISELSTPAEVSAPTPTLERLTTTTTRRPSSPTSQLSSRPTSASASPTSTTVDAPSSTTDAATSPTATRRTSLSADGGTHATGGLNGSDGGESRIPTAEPVASPAALLYSIVAGKYVVYGIQEANRPIYGFGTLVEAWYCTDGSLAIRSDSQRTTPLGNVERKARNEVGNWTVIDAGPDRAIIRHTYLTGGGNELAVVVTPDGRWAFPEGMGGQVQGDASC